MPEGLTAQEITSIETAADAAGQYLDSINQTDLAKLTKTQWMTLNECIVVTALDKLAELSLDEIPFPV